MVSHESSSAAVSAQPDDGNWNNSPPPTESGTTNSFPIILPSFNVRFPAPGGNPFFSVQWKQPSLQYVDFSTEKRQSASSSDDNPAAQQSLLQQILSGNPTETPSYELFSQDSLTFSLQPLVKTAHELYSLDVSPSTENHNSIIYEKCDKQEGVSLRLSKQDDRIANHFVSDSSYSSFSSSNNASSNHVRLISVKGCTAQITEQDSTAQKASLPQSAMGESFNLSIPSRILILTSGQKLLVTTENRSQWALDEAIKLAVAEHWKRDKPLYYEISWGLLSLLFSSFEKLDSPAPKRRKSSDDNTDYPSKSQIFAATYKCYKKKKNAIDLTKKRQEKMNKEERDLLKKAFDEAWKELKCPKNSDLKQKRLSNVRQYFYYRMKHGSSGDSESLRDMEKTNPKIQKNERFLYAYLERDMSKITCMDIMSISGGFYLIVVGFTFGYFIVFKSDLQNSESALEEVFRSPLLDAPLLEASDGEGAEEQEKNAIKVSATASLLKGLSHLVWITRTTLLSGTNRGSVLLTFLGSNADQDIFCNTEELYPASDSPIIDLFYFKGQNREFIVIVKSLEVVVVSFVDSIANHTKHTYSSDSIITSAQVYPNPVKGNYFVCIASEDEIVQWNLVFDQNAGKIQADTHHSDSCTVIYHHSPSKSSEGNNLKRRQSRMFRGVQPSPNGVLLFSLVQDDFDCHLEILSLFPLDMLREYLINIRNHIRGTTDIFTYCTLMLGRGKKALEFAHILQSFDRVPGLRRILYRLSPLVIPSERQYAFRCTFYDHALTKILPVGTRSENSALLFCDWMLNLYQLLLQEAVRRDKSELCHHLFTAQVLDTMYAVYELHNDDKCARQVKLLAQFCPSSKLREGENSKMELRSMMVVNTPIRDGHQCSICMQPFGMSCDAVSTEFTPHCGHSVSLSIETLLPVNDLEKHWCCNACGCKSDKEMLVCPLCGNEHCSMVNVC